MSEMTEETVTRVPGITVRQDKQKVAKAAPETWGLFVDVRLNGVRHNPSAFYATEAEAWAAYPAAAARLAAWRVDAKHQAALKQAMTVPPVQTVPKAPKGVELFQTIALRWLEEHVRPNKKSGTYCKYEGIVRNHLNPLMGTWPVNDETLTKPRIRRALRTELAARGASLKTRRFCQARLAEILTWAQGELPPKQLTWNPASGEGAFIKNLGEAEPKDPPPNPMTRGQVEQLLVWVKEHQPDLWEPYLWLADTGARLGEMCAVKRTHLEHLDRLGRGLAHISETFSDKHRKMERLAAGATSKQDEVAGIGEQPTKTGRKNQTIDLSPRLVEALLALFRRQKEGWLARGRYGKFPEHCFLNTRLRPLRPTRRVYGTFRKACTALGLVGQTGERFTIHCLRDTFATLAILSGKEIGWVSEMLGHESEKTTRDFYYKWIRQTDANPLAEEGR